MTDVVSAAVDRQDRRRKAVEQSRASIRVEGGDVTCEVAALSERYIAGELSIDQLVQEGLRSLR